MTSTANYDSNANGRAERAVLFFQEKARTLLSTQIRSEIFQKQLKTLWTFAVQHVGEVHINDVMKLPACRYEFGQRILARVANPNSKLDPRLQSVVFLGFAPNVTSGFYVMRSDGVIELTSNITEETTLDKEEELLKEGVNPRQSGLEAKPKKSWEEMTPEERMLEDIMGFAGGNHPVFDPNFQGEWNAWDEFPPDDPFSQVVKKNVAQIMKAKFDDNLWENEDIKQEEIPDELKESGAINVSLKDVKNSIGKDRAAWKLALEGELNSLQETGAVVKVKHVPRGVQVLPMKVVLTLKPVPGTHLKKKKARGCVCGNYQDRSPMDLLYTANIDVTSIRMALAIAAQNPTWGITILDVATAFLNAPMPKTEEQHAVYVRPPALFEQFHLVKPGTYWKLESGVWTARKSTVMGKRTGFEIEKATAHMSE